VCGGHCMRVYVCVRARAGSHETESWGQKKSHELRMWLFALCLSLTRTSALELLLRCICKMISIRYRHRSATNCSINPRTKKLCKPSLLGLNSFLNSISLEVTPHVPDISSFFSRPSNSCVCMFLCICLWGEFGGGGLVEWDSESKRERESTKRKEKESAWEKKRAWE